MNRGTKISLFRCGKSGNPTAGLDNQLTAVCQQVVIIELAFFGEPFLSPSS